MSSNTTIHVGFWTNYSKGGASGSTLTLTKSNGSILIAALAIFIQLIGGQTWGIIRFATHQLRTTTKAQDGFHHQQQAILRNNQTDANTIWNLAMIAYAWRSRTSNGFRRSISLVSIAIIHLLAFGAASILASHITTANDEVLIAPSPYCGPWNQSYFSDFNERAILEDNYAATMMHSSSEYVQNCLKQSQLLPECNIFKSQKFDWISARNATCPFGDLCLGPANSSLYLDTGLMDSRRDLGINSQNTDRVQWRKNATCIPITTKGYSKQGTTSINYRHGPYRGETTFNYTALFYGPTVFPPSIFGVTDTTLANSTYVYTNYIDATFPPANAAIPPYDIETSMADPGVALFTPIPALSPGNSTLTLTYAVFFYGYTEPSDDLWLSAHIPTNLTFMNSYGNKTNITLYEKDEPVSVLACLEQQQFCNPSSQLSKAPRCTPFWSMYYTPTEEEFDEVFNNEHQKTIAKAVLFQSSYSAFNYAMNMVPLLARNLYGDEMSLPLASDQWVLEVTNWFTVGLAQVQRLMLEYITGPSLPEYLQIAVRDQLHNDTNLAWLCGSQIIRHSDFTNFRTISFAMIFAFGVIIFVVNQSLETVVGWFRSRWRSGRWRQRAWWAEGTLQLQRRAFESMGVKDWELDEWDRVPVTEKGRKWSAFKNWDEMLPVAREQKRIFVVTKQVSPTSSGPRSGNGAVQVGSPLSGTEVEGWKGRPYSV